MGREFRQLPPTSVSPLTGLTKKILFSGCGFQFLLSFWRQSLNFAQVRPMPKLNLHDIHRSYGLNYKAHLVLYMVLFLMAVNFRWLFFMPPSLQNRTERPLALAIQCRIGRSKIGNVHFSSLCRSFHNLRIPQQNNSNEKSTLNNAEWTERTDLDGCRKSAVKLKIKGHIRSMAAFRNV